MEDNFRDPTDHGRPDHSFFIAETLQAPVNWPDSVVMAVDFALGFERVRVKSQIASQAAIASKLAPTGK